MADQIKECFAAAVHWGREVAKEEELLAQVEARLQLARCRLQATETDLLGLLPVKSTNTKTRLIFALASSATAAEILESLNQA
jgi:hypothetical protein